MALCYFGERRGGCKFCIRNRAFYLSTHIKHLHTISWGAAHGTLVQETPVAPPRPSRNRRSTGEADLSQRRTKSVRRKERKAEKRW